MLSIDYNLSMLYRLQLKYVNGIDYNLCNGIDYNLRMLMGIDYNLSMLRGIDYNLSMLMVSITT